jgi:hypothetical protein
MTTGTGPTDAEDQPTAPSWRQELASYKSGAATTGGSAALDAPEDAVEPAEEDVDEAAPVAGAMARAIAGSGRRSILPVALAVIFGLLAVVMFIVAGQLKNQRDEAREAESGVTGDRAEVAAVTGQFGEAILSYDYTDIEGSQQRVLDLSTGQFQREYETGFEGFAELIEKTEASSVATVTAVFVGDVSDERAEAIAVVDAAVTGTGGTRAVADSYIRLDLVKVGETWKVDGVTSLNFASAGDGSAVPGASTTTTAPGPSE